MVMSGVPPPMIDALRRVRRCICNASVDVLRRTRRNAYTIRGAVPNVNHRTSCRGSGGSASYHRDAVFKARAADMTIGCADSDQAGARPYLLRRPSGSVLYFSGCTLAIQWFSFRGGQLGVHQFVFRSRASCSEAHNPIG